MYFMVVPFRRVDPRSTGRRPDRLLDISPNVEWIGAGPTYRLTERIEP
jgi:hypothetical protein